MSFESCFDGFAGSKSALAAMGGKRSFEGAKPGSKSTGPEGFILTK